MSKVTVNPPKTPVTKGSSGIAKATLPNVCKMPGPPAPFVPSPLPNIGKSGSSPKGYTKKVKVEGKAVAITGASFGSSGDAASKGTGGGLVSANTHGPTKFLGPGSLDTKFEGKNVQLLGDPMLNNCGPSGAPPNSATLSGVDQDDGDAVPEGSGEHPKKEKPKCAECGKHHSNLGELNSDGDKTPAQLIKKGLGRFRKQRDVTASDFDRKLCDLAQDDSKSAKVVRKLTKQAKAKIDKLKNSERRGRH